MYVCVSILSDYEESLSCIKSDICNVIQGFGYSSVNNIEGPSGGSRAAAAVADGYREVEVSPAPEPGDCSLSTFISATTIPVDTWPPISSGSA